MRIRTKKFLREKFKQYYKKTDIQLPPRLQEREWGMIYLDKNFPEKTVMKRHVSFTTRKEIQNYLETMISAHCYFSSAYYERPSASTMDKKKWKGADLVFDLDADHLEETQNLDYPEMLEKVKKETIHLIEDFLLDDLGFSIEKMQIVFSGGRGYHIHIRDEKIHQLNSQERREIIDYILGKDLIPPIEEKKEKNKTIKQLSSKETNWNKKIQNYIFNKYLQSLIKKDIEEAKKELTKLETIGEKKSEKIIDYLKKEGNLEKIKEKRKLEIVKGVSDRFWTQLIEKAKKEIKAQADEPVTSDIKRLIRLPTSLHAGTGFKVTPLELDEVKEFNPFNDAIVFNQEPVKIYPKQDYTIKLFDEEIKIKKQDIKEIPAYAAIFLCCLGMAEVEGW